MKENDKCPICDLGLLTKVIQDESFIIEGQEIILHNVISYHCINGCGEIFADNKSFKKISKILKGKQNEIIQSKVKRND